ncbi:hypothetical protein [Alloactinosynnema sp. L-07]|uniref:effector-associated constant component EACC1 n=1 Tax=Alloactinosynnema sp. L-07 TaxID=1653480 RepID=UPI00065F0522|nr:hypothetical protein [Alloactinosynnema sp. L-07]CRK57614.1 hypothetical protein [Alloactinosynnema sp. L-07]
MSGVVVSVSDPAELRSLRDHLRRVPDLDLVQVPGVPAVGEQGVWDVLQLSAASGGVLVVAVRTLPAFIKSRRSSVSITVKTGDKTITLTADNVADVLPVVEKALDA